jgi:hypothetical protein
MEKVESKIMLCECGKVKSSFKQMKCDECKEKGRIWIESTKKYCYIYCRCGEIKESYKSSYCVKCQRVKYNRSVGKNRTDYKLEYITKDDARARLGSLIKRVEDDNGCITLQDLFIEMITLYNHYFASNGMDEMRPGKQLTTMWKKLNQLYYKIA